MKYLSLLACLFFGCAQTVVVRDPVSTVDRARQLEEETVALVQSDGSVYCSGVWIGPELILTAAHCVQHGTEPADWPETLEWYPVGAVTGYSTFAEQDHTYKGTVLGFDPDHDLGLISALNGPTHRSSVVELGAISKGERVMVMGMPAGEVWTFSSGDLAAVREADGVKVIQTTAVIYFGSSGGPMQNAYGNLIGIASYMNIGGRYGGSRNGYFIHRDHILEFLSKYTKPHSSISR